jgi:hypothetical protein
MTARRACAVQMLLVAFSRRMCCSRVWQRHPQRAMTLRVLGHADDPPREEAG